MNKWIVIKDGQRIGPTYESQEAANAAADQLRRQLTESNGASSNVSVVQNLLG